MNQPHEKLACEYTPAEIKKLAQFFGLLWETQQMQKGCNENQECNYQADYTE